MGGACGGLVGVSGEILFMRQTQTADYAKVELNSTIPKMAR